MALSVSILKKGSKCDASNYRPISLTSVLCKLCEHILHSTVLTHIASHKILSDEPHGFRRRISRDNQLLQALSDFARGLEDKSPTDIIFLDFAKALDKVSHQGLLKKLITMVFVDMPLNGLKVFLAAAHSRWLLMATLALMPKLHLVSLKVVFSVPSSFCYT